MWALAPSPTQVGVRSLRPAAPDVEIAAVFGDALRRLAAAAAYLCQDWQRYWYSTQPTVTQRAEDRADQLKRDTDTLIHELDRRLR